MRHQGVATLRVLIALFLSMTMRRAYPVQQIQCSVMEDRGVVLVWIDDAALLMRKGDDS